MDDLQQKNKKYFIEKKMFPYLKKIIKQYL